MMNTTELDHAYTAQTYARFPIVLSHGKQCTVWDENQKAYLDFTSGIGVNSLGWADDTWLAAVTHQAGTLQHTSNLFYTRPAAELAEKLVQRSKMANVFFANSGAEANEGAIKTARKYSHDKYGDQRPVILTLQQSFHGRTITTLAATGQDYFHQHFFPFTAGFEHVVANDVVALQQRLDAKDDVCAIMLEVIQGEGGLNALDVDFLQFVQKQCHERDILLIVDEVQTGVARTGQFLAYQHFDLKPDLVTLAKGLGGGLPIGAVLFGEKCQNTLGKGDHGSTFGGNPVSAAAANAVLARLDDEFCAEVARKGEKLRQELLCLPHVQSVSGMGLMLGVAFDEDIKATDVQQQAMNQGVLFLTAKHKLRLLPPLIISDDEMLHGVDVLRDVLSKMK